MITSQVNLPSLLCLAVQHIEVAARQSRGPAWSMQKDVRTGEGQEGFVFFGFLLCLLFLSERGRHTANPIVLKSDKCVKSGRFEFSLFCYVDGRVSG